MDVTKVSKCKLFLNIKKVFLSFLILLSITGVVTTIFPVGLGKVIIVFFVPYVIYCITKDNYKFNRTYTVIYLSFLAIVLLLYLLIFVSSSGDYSYPYLLLLNNIEFIPLAIIITYLVRKIMLRDRYILIKLFIYASLINSIVVYVNIFIPSTREIVQSIIPVLSNIPEDYFFRVAGLSNSPGSALSIFHGIGVVFSFFMAYKVNNKRDRFKFLFIMCIIFFSIFFIARTGMVFSIVVIFLFSLINIRLHHFFNLNALLLKSLFFIIFIFIFIFIFILDTKQQYLIVEDFIPWAFEIFINLFQNGNISSESTNDLFNNHMFLPSSYMEILFGTGFYDRIYINSDSPYVRSIFAVGIIGTLLIYVYFPILIYFVKKYFLDKGMYSLFVVIILVLLGLEIKLPFIYVGKTSIILFSIIFSEIYYIQNIKKSNK